MQTALEEDPFSGQVFVFRGRVKTHAKLPWWTGDGRSDSDQAGCSYKV
ncbi:IS66 family insertion sequence element accessory protein TnpB [Duganella lactea]